MSFNRLWGHPCLTTITEQSYRFGTTSTREGFTILSDFRNHHLRVYRCDGTFDHNIGGPYRGIVEGKFDRPRGIAAIHGTAHPPVADRVIVCDSGNVRMQLLEVDTGKVLWCTGCGGKMRKPWDVALLHDKKHIVIADIHMHVCHILRLKDGAYVTHFPEVVPEFKVWPPPKKPGELFSPCLVRIDHQGRILVLDHVKGSTFSVETGDFRVQAFAPDGTYLCEVTRQHHLPATLATPDRLDPEKARPKSPAKNFIDKLVKSEREKEAAGETREDGGTWSELRRELVFADSL